MKSAKEASCDSFLFRVKEGNEPLLDPPSKKSVEITASSLGIRNLIRENAEISEVEAIPHYLIHWFSG